MPTPDERHLIELDSRGRASIGKFTNSRRHYFLDVDQASGVITLIPAVVMTETEMTLARNPEPGADREPSAPRTEWREGIYKILAAADGPMKAEGVWAAARRANIWATRLDVATILTDLLIRKRITEPEVGSFEANTAALTPALAKRIQDLPEEPGRRQRWIHDLLVESGGPLKYAEIFQAVKGAGFAGTRAAISEDLTELIREGLVETPDYGHYQAKS